MCDNTLLRCWHILLAPSSPKSVWWMLHSIFYWGSTPYQPKNGIKMLARFILQHFRIIACAISSHCHLLALYQYFQHCFSFSFPRIYYDTAIGKDKMGKMYCRSYSTQISLKKKAEMNTQGVANGSSHPSLSTKLWFLGTSSLFLSTLQRHTHFLSSFHSILRVNSCFLTIM